MYADADKRAYSEYFELCLKLLRSGGILALDNVLWYGRVADPAVGFVSLSWCVCCQVSAKTLCMLQLHMYGVCAACCLKVFSRPGLQHNLCFCLSCSSTRMMEQLDSVSVLFGTRMECWHTTIGYRFMVAEHPHAVVMQIYTVRSHSLRFCLCIG